MCYWASEISAHTAKCSRFAMGQDEGRDNKRRKRGTDRVGGRVEAEAEERKRRRVK